jgi:hypothetical protein
VLSPLGWNKFIEQLALVPEHGFELQLRNSMSEEKRDSSGHALHRILLTAVGSLLPLILHCVNGPNQAFFTLYFLARYSLYYDKLL